MTKRIPESAWAFELHKFSSRNAGRTITLEVDSPDFSADANRHGHPLRGIAYDSRDRRVLITLGDQTSAELHLTHAIEKAEAIFVLIDLRGRDEALAIAQRDNSQTLLRFLDL
jgi:hypothetical protein